MGERIAVVAAHKSSEGTECIHSVCVCEPSIRSFVRRTSVLGPTIPPRHSLPKDLPVLLTHALNDAPFSVVPDGWATTAKGDDDY